jgi:hypothetical protein
MDSDAAENADPDSPVIIPLKGMDYMKALSLA